MANFNVYLLWWYACNQKDNDGELFYSKTIHRFVLLVLVQSTWPSNLGCSSFGKRMLPLTRSWLAVWYITGFF